MLAELRVSQLGVIDDVTIVLGPGLTALTGETGAGKTLVVDAIQLLAGGPADPGLVRPGATEALVEGRFLTRGPSGPPAGGSVACGGDEADEMILSRVVPASGRSRCYIDGRMVSAARLAEVGRRLVEVHGQHAQHSLLSTAAQREALDRAAGIDVSEVSEARRRVRELQQARAGLGGDPRARARQLDLVNHQLREIDDASLGDPGEEQALRDEEEVLAHAAELIVAADRAWRALAGDDGLVERLGAVIAAAGSLRPLEALQGRLAGLQEELSDTAAEARRIAESVEDDPERLAAIGERRRVLRELRRKYGGSLEEVLAYSDQLRAQVDELVSHDERAAALDVELGIADKELAGALERLWRERTVAAGPLAGAVETELHRLAMPRARFAVEVGEEPGDEGVTWLLGANPGEPLLPLAKVASGGELSRAMLALRLVTGRPPDGCGPDGPGTLVFDEVDAGIGGEASLAVGRALAAVAADHQVLVVTHLPQVAAFATRHVAVAKDVAVSGGAERTVAAARPVEGGDRVVELARMLSGRPDSSSARRHAEELLAAAVSEAVSSLEHPPASPRRRGRMRRPTGGPTESR